jgi:transposase InsO family protein
LAPSSVGRMLKEPPVRPPSSEKDVDTVVEKGAVVSLSASEPGCRRPRAVTAKYPHHVWHIDLTVVPTALGFWVPWVPFAQWPGWPFCWWVTVVLDHYSRKALACGVFKRAPKAGQVVGVLESTVQKVGRAPKYTVTDQGAQFQDEYLDWCRRRGVKPRFGAVGESGSIAVVERFMRTLKHECCARILVPFGLEAMRREAELFCRWYDGHRPHQGLRGATPDERYHGRRPAHEGPRVEARARYPVQSGETAIGPPKRVKRLELVVSYQEGRRHLPLVELKQAA